MKNTRRSSQFRALVSSLSAVSHLPFALTAGCPPPAVNFGADRRRSIAIRTFLVTTHPLRAVTSQPVARASVLILLQLPCSTKYVVEHGASQPARVRVLTTGVVATQDRCGLAIRTKPHGRFRAVAELRKGRRPINRLTKNRIPCDLPQRDDHPNAIEELDLAGKVRRAGRKLGARGLVVGGCAARRGRNEGIGQRQAVAFADR